MKEVLYYIILIGIFITSCNGDGVKQEGKKKHLNTFVYSTGIYLEKYVIHESGAGMFDTGTDYEWMLIDSIGNELSLGVTYHDDFLDLRLLNDTLYLTYVRRERNMNDLSEIIYSYKEEKTKAINLPKHGFKIVKHNTDASKNPINELAKNMTFIEGGIFNMVSRWSERTKPVNPVEVKSFYICKYEVTQELWVKVMGYNPSLFKDSTNFPVENIDWHESQEFVEKLNSKYDTKYRLPTEAEWEYAARGGIEYRNDTYWVNLLGTTAWYKNNSKHTTHQIGTRSPNGYRLYDMIGNVEEWCSDWYDSDYLKTDSTINQNKVVRGGSWKSNYAECIPTERDKSHPKYGHSNKIGLRLALDNK